MLATGEGPKLHVFDKIIFEKHRNFKTKRVPLMLIYSIYSDIRLYKKGTFHHKKGHFWSFENIGGGRAPCTPPPPPQFIRPAVNLTR